MSDDKRYVRADQISAMFGWTALNEMAMRQQLTDGLKSGRVSARADDAMLNRGTRKINGHWSVVPMESLKDWEVEPAVWGYGSIYLSARRYQTKSAKDFISVELTGLWFSAADLVSQLGWKEVGTASEATPMAATKKGGRKPAKGWPVFAAALAEWVMNSGDDEVGFVEKGPDTILGEVLKIAQSRTDEELARSTFQPAVQEFVDLMTQASRRK